MKITMSLLELESAVEYAKENGSGEHKAVIFTFEDTGIGTWVGISEDYDGEPVDISDYDAW